MNKVLLYIVLVIVIILFIRWFIAFRKRKNNVINLVSGANGSGKTFTATNDIINDYFKALKHWKKINQPGIIRKLFRLIPYFKKKNESKEDYGLSKPLLYSNYPILIDKKKHIYSVNLDNDIMLLKVSIPLNSIVVIDEFSSWVNQFEYNEKFSKCLNDHFQKWRHYHGDYSKMYCIDQSSSNFPLQVKRRSNRILCCDSIRHYLGFIHILRYKYIECTEDIKTIEINGSKDIKEIQEDTDDKTSKRVMFSILKRYDSRAYSNRYTYVDNAISDLNAKYIDSPLKVNFVIETPKERGVILNERIREIEENKKDN